MSLAAQPVGDYRESPVFFSADGEQLFGVLTSPTTAVAGVSVTMLSGAWYGTATHRNRVFVRLARRITAGTGCHCLRVDYHGAGESTGMSHLGLDDPFPDDLEGAVRWLESQGIRRHMVVGACLGSRTALMAASRILGLEGVILLAPPLGTEADHEQGVYRVISAVLDAFRYLVAERIPVLVVYGRAEAAREVFERDVVGCLHGEGGVPGRELQVRSVPGRVNGARRVEVQDAILDVVADWISERVLSVRS